MTHDPLPRGIVTPLVTFLDADGGPDRPAMTALVDYQLTAGIHGILAVGSTGELGNLLPEQRDEAIRIVVEATAGRAPVWAGVAGLGTTEAVRAARGAVEHGADALLVLPPMFFDPSDSELARHFRIIKDAVGETPVIAYDVPPRGIPKITAAAVAGLAREGVLAGVKDSSGDLTAGRLTIEATADVPAFRTYIGSEITIDAALALGFHGVVPGFANVLPRPAVDIIEAFDRGDSTAALAAQKVYLRLFDVLRIPLSGAGGPAAAINALKVGTAWAIGLPVPAISEPMVQPDAEFVDAVRSIVAELAVPA